jgi:hypothetical protein
MDEEALDRFAYDVHEAYRHGVAAQVPELALSARGGKAAHGTKDRRVHLPIVADAEE